MLKRVLVVQGEHLLADGISSLLSGQSDMNVFNISFVNGSALIEKIEEIRPSTVIVGMNHGLGEITSLATLLRICPEIRVIIIDDEKNLIHIYDKQELAVARSADLIAAVRS